MRITGYIATSAQVELLIDGGAWKTQFTEAPNFIPHDRTSHGAHKDGLGWQATEELALRKLAGAKARDLSSEALTLRA